MGNSHKDDCSCITDAGLIGGALCSFNLAHRYATFPMSIYQKMPKSEKTPEKRLKFFFGGHGSGGPDRDVVSPI